MALIEVKNLFKNYQVGKVLFPALRGIDLVIEDGEFTAIAGPSGSGKTTLLNIIGCLDTMSQGDIKINGVSINELNALEKADLRKDKIGFVFQTFNLIPVLTAYENVEMPLLILNFSDAEKKQLITGILSEVGLADYLNRRPNEMSGGQQQRVAIARALVKNPAMVLADEPTANLDSSTGREILKLMKELNKKHKTTFIFSTHDQLVMEFAERIIMLRDGKVVGDESKNKGKGKSK
ncbi:ABC transporter [candidate division WOR-3 bacterium RBG_13_43_14]|uniref:ABC transporter n=1 Tax=candidate division WOR-3 bacterium RBG_13_43_14 TaxID=1802590 RepID=A0A1F4U1P0_UNCW3|nr:MAG: ABC transporter [candidate division WOR-3 bacterium RBG_13_43_14]